MGKLWQRLKDGLTKTREGFSQRVNELLVSSRNLDDTFWENLEEILIQSDVGVKTTLELVEAVRQRVREGKIKEPQLVRELLQEEMTRRLDQGASSLVTRSDSPPAVILVVGVNGVGKTTTIGKLACRLKQEGKSVVLGAADTFRAAAIDQLVIWGERAGVPVIKHQTGADPAAVVFDAVQAGRARKTDVVLIDTAGRLQNKTNLMQEIQKIRRIIDRELPGAPHEVLLVLDATTGQNAIAQAKVFTETLGVTGIALTKLDGTARGGVVLAIANELGIPVKLVGVGESSIDLQDFDSRSFVAAIFAESEGEEERS